jgi:prepilin-type N-terminal cleavage/methylation domain-containing protein
MKTYQKSLFFKKGFTLIELLVVIAIIGILSAIVLAMLNTARNKGKDASAKTSLNSIRTTAEVYYYGSGASNYMTTPASSGVASQDSAAATAGTLNVCIDASIIKLAAAAKVQTGNAVNCIVGTNGTTYVVWSRLNGQTAPANYCVDSSGFAGDLSVAAANITATAAVSCK